MRHHNLQVEFLRGVKRSLMCELSGGMAVKALIGAADFAILSGHDLQYPIRRTTINGPKLRVS